ncbi:MAG TPA: hotdog fold thioesterase [Mizugakiibacter sp.]|nr:hotdog fold thioesterase [Mizugakiibacter sp.]
MAIWHSEYSLESLNAHSHGTLAEVLSIRFIEIGEDFIRATMPVDARTRQPFGLLHGGASVALAETLGSTAANLCCTPGREYAVGLEINANHVHSVRAGEVTGVARPLHRGRSSQVWEIRIYDDSKRLVCVSRLTCAVIAQAQAPSVA